MQLFLFFSDIFSTDSFTCQGKEQLTGDGSNVDLRLAELRLVACVYDVTHHRQLAPTAFKHIVYS